MILFAGTLFLSAALLFVVQPMTGRRFLPLLGGSPAVWTACMLFFQTALLAGYAYAHGLSSRWALRRQAAVHAAVLGLPLLVFFFVPFPTDAPGAANPVLWLLGALAVTVGFPFFAVSTTAPLLQRWYAAAGSQDPYWLYSASNAGSLAALLAYPLLLEPWLGLGAQESAWRLGYGVFACAALACALRAARAPDAAPGAEPATPPEPAPAWTRRLRWIALSAAPSSLLVGSTAHLSINISPFPLLWVVPLGLYLLTFILAFARRPLIPHALVLQLQPLFVAGLAAIFFWEGAALDRAFTLVAPLHLGALFVTALACHGELAADRPSARHLTDFYLATALGGALGGAFNALVAPLVFPVIAEYPIMVAAACLLRPKGKGSFALDGAWSWMIASSGPLLAFGAGIFLEERRADLYDLRALVVAAPPALLSVVVMRRPWPSALCVAVALAAGVWGSQRGVDVPHRDRSFFGAHHVERAPTAGLVYLVNGHILHGTQAESRPEEPLSYYHRTGPCGQVFQAFQPGFERRRVGAVGLGAGTVSAYSKPGERWTFWEIDAAVERTARKHFRYLELAKGEVGVVLGDGRLGIAREADGAFDLLLFDAFSSDAIPAHLLTREAVRLYLRKCAPKGVLAFHISCRFVDLKPVLASIAREEGLATLVREEGELEGSYAENLGKSDSTWAVLARTAEDLEPLLKVDGRWGPLAPAPTFRAWTDDFAPLATVIKWPWSKGD